MRRTRCCRQSITWGGRVGSNPHSRGGSEMKFRLRLGWLWGSTVALACSGCPVAVEAASALHNVPTCREVAEFLNRTATPRDVSGKHGWGENNLQCGLVGGGVAGSALELLKARWNRTLRRWEFALRCAHPEDCVPFLVWSRTPAGLSAESLATTDLNFLRRSFLASPSARKAQASNHPGGGEHLVKLGQTAMLTWEQSGLRVVLPVTCLEAGAMGEFVRVRFRNAPGVLRAEVVGTAVLRVQL